MTTPGISFADMQQRFDVTGQVSLSSYRSKYGNNNVAPLKLSSLFPEISSVAGATNAYATRSLTRSFTGACVQVRRGSDNALADVYMTMGGTVYKIIADGITTTGNSALTTWLGGASGYVRIWYDQVGTANLTETTTNDRQPLFDTSTNSVHINNTKTSSIGLSYGSAWSINDATFVVNFIPVSYVNAMNVGGTPWWDMDPIIGGERPNYVADWGLFLQSGTNFGFGAVAAGSGVTVASNGFNAKCVCAVARTGSTGALTLFRDGTSISTGTQTSGTVFGPTPTYVGKVVINGVTYARSNVKMLALFHYASAVPNANITTLSHVAGN